MVALVVDRVVLMLNYGTRGLRATRTALALLRRLLELHSSFDVPRLPELVGLIAKAIAPVMLGGAYVVPISRQPVATSECEFVCSILRVRFSSTSYEQAATTRKSDHLDVV